MALPRYESILAGKEKPAFKLSLDDGDLNDSIHLAKKHLTDCHLCPWDCGKARAEGKGVCGVGPEPNVTSIILHQGEEDVLIPSLTVFFSGCNLSCVYCQNWDISTDAEKGSKLTARELATQIDRLAPQAKNVNFVGGDPIPSIPFILETLSYVKADIPVVFNSNMYMSSEASRLLRPAVDMYLADIKYGNDECAKRLSNAKEYIETIQRSIFYATSHEVEKRRDLLVRHLVLPGHNGCCSRPIIKTLAVTIPESTLNVMSQYRPEYKAKEHDDLRHGLKYTEFLKAYKYAEELGLDLT